MLCYRCGSHVPDESESCPTCGQKLAQGGVGPATATFSRKRLTGSDIPGAPLKKGELFAKRYLVSDALFAGPFGFGFLARDRALEVDVTLQLIHPSFLLTRDAKQHFQKVLRSVRGLSHPGMARVYECGEEREWVFLTAQRVEGMSLRKIMDLRQSKKQPFTLKEAEPICAQLLSVLAEAHQVSPHGDLRPENVVVLPDLLKVENFGLGMGLPQSVLVEARQRSGTQAYLAPEQIAGQNVDLRADLYAMGMILGEMLSGTVPSADTASFGEWYPRSTSAHPEDRFPDAKAFLESLSKATQEIPPPLRPGMAQARTVNIRRTAKLSPETSVMPPALLPSPTTVADKPPPPVAEINLPSERPARSLRQDELTALSVATEMVPSAPPAPPSDASAADHSVPLPLTRRKMRRARIRPLPWKWLSLLAAAGIMAGVWGGWYATKEASLPPFGSPPVPLPVAAHKSDPKSPLATDAGPASAWAAAKSALMDAGNVRLVGGSAGVCPEGMRFVGSGSFRMGTPTDDDMRSFDERPLALVDVAAFCVDFFEYPNRRGATPTAFVSWSEAKQLCEAQGKRLCAEREWEKACKGPPGIRFPYGDEFDADACNTQDNAGEDRRVANSGKFDRCRSGYGVSDLSGNLAEWTASPFASGAEMAQKGGAFNRPDYAARCSARKSGTLSVKSAAVGFRCCLSVP